jgi:UDP-4-amino-4,6-dideoxy-N-acetyl-beta-L-altrosamine N-acetyltransferase
MTATLRPMREDDLDRVLAWRNAEDVRLAMYTWHEITPREHRAWWDAQRVDPATRLLVCEDDGVPLGVVTFTRYTGPGGTATWAFYSGDRTRRGTGRVMERLALEYAFDTLQLHRLECEVLSSNRAVVDFHRRHGFTLEGTAREAYARDGARFDIHKLAMLASTWRKLVGPQLRGERAGGELAGRTFAYRFAVTPALVDAYAAATGDDNPVHLDDAAAQALGFPGRIAHGMLLGGQLSRYFANTFPGRGTIYVSQSMEFLAPVRVGAEVEVSLRVASHLGRRVVLEFTMQADGQPCVRGESVLMLPPGFVPPAEGAA